MPRFGEAIAHRRRELGYRSGSDLAAFSREAAVMLASEEYAPFSQQTLSKLEAASTEKAIANTRPRIQRMLSCLLGWNEQEFQAHVGVGIVAVDYVMNEQRKPVRVVRGREHSLGFGSSSPLTEADVRHHALEYIDAMHLAPMAALHITNQTNDTLSALVTLEDHSTIVVTGSYSPIDISDRPDILTGMADDPPQALLSAVQQYRDIDPLIADPDVLTRLSRAGFWIEYGPDTPLEWIQFFTVVRPWLLPRP